MKSETGYKPNFLAKSVFLGQIFFANIIYDKKTYILILVSIVPLLALGQFSQITESTFIDLISAGEETSIFSFAILPLICLILGISAIADEKENKTVSQLLSKPVKREEIVITKWITILIIGLIIVCIDAFILYIGLCIYIQDFSILLEHFDILIGSWLYLGLWVTVYITIFLFLGIVIDKNPLGWGLALAYFEAFFGQFIFGIAGGGTSPFSIVNHINYIASEFFLSKYMNVNIIGVDPLQSLLVCLGLIVGFLLLSIEAMKRKDFP